MSDITAIIVDDEINARENLRYLLATFCKEIVIVAEAENVDEAFEKITNKVPDIVFLDIEMPGKNGFQLLDLFSQVDFQVIFITAYDSYAIKAFQVAAIDYLLKPVDISLLKKAIVKVKEQVELKLVNKRVSLLLKNKKKINQIAIPYKSDYVILSIKKIVCIEADRMYVIIYTIDNKKYVIAKKMSHYEKLFEEERSVVRVHRSWMINMNYVKVYSKKEKNIELTTKKIVPVSKGYKSTFETLFYS